MKSSLVVTAIGSEMFSKPKKIVLDIKLGRSF